MVNRCFLFPVVPFLIVVALLTVTGSVVAQPVGSIRGVVYDKDFESPLPLAKVKIAETGAEVTATEQGNYVFNEVPPGTYTLVFHKQGYTRQVKANVVVNAGQLTDVDVWLSGEFTEMEEFVVQDLQIGGGTEAGLLMLRIESPALMDSISADLMSQAGASDAAAGLRLVSGATTTEDGFAAVRGLPPRFVSTQLNGFVLPSADPDTRAVQLDLFPSEVIESIQVSKTFTPDQQGSASGGAVNIVTKSIPDQNFIKFSTKTEYNTQRPDDGEFMRDARGDVSFFGSDSARDLAPGFGELRDGVELPGGPGSLSTTEFGSPSPQFTDAPLEYSWDVTGGLRHEFDTGVSIGGLATFFWDQDMSYDDGRINNDLVAKTGQFDLGLIPDVSNASNDGFLQDPTNIDDNVLTSLFDETRSQHEVTWGGLGTLGLESENHKLDLTFMHTRITTSTVTIGEDTRSKHLKFPGHDPTQVQTPGGAEDPTHGDEDTRNFAPYRRLEIQEYIERTVQSLQFNGEHTLPLFQEGFGVDGVVKLLPPIFDWNVALSRSEREEPGTTIFDTKFLSAAEIGPFVSGEQNLVTFDNANLGPFNVIFRDIEENSTQYRLNLKLPFEQWTGDQGFIKFGLFDDHTTRDFRQDTFALLGSSLRFFSPFDAARLSEAFTNPGQFPVDTSSPPNLSGLNGNLGELEPSSIDFRFDGQQDIDAWYWMTDLPLTSYFKLIGGMRFENTRLSTDLQPDGDVDGVLVDAKELAERGIPPGNNNSFDFLESQGISLDADIDQSDVLPSIGFVLSPLEGLDVRASYSETVARPTFRELTPISQSLFAGDTPFVGNPLLKMSAVENYDLRVDYQPEVGSFFSVSYFKKEVEDPIQVIQQAQGTSNLIIPVNFPEGTINGWEFEARQDLGLIFESLQGLTIGGNATLLDTEVRLRDFETNLLTLAGAPQDTIEMTNAPEFLYNLFFTYNSEQTGTQFSLFWTFRGDTLIAGPGIEGDIGTPTFFSPAVYETGFGTLNFTLTQKIGEHLKLSFSAKNLTNPAIETVYRSDYVPGGDVVKTSSRKGIDLSVGISAEFEF